MMQMVRQVQAVPFEGCALDVQDSVVQPDLRERLVVEQLVSIHWLYLERVQQKSRHRSSRLQLLVVLAAVVAVPVVNLVQEQW